MLRYLAKEIKFEEPNFCGWGVQCAYLLQGKHFATGWKFQKTVQTLLTVLQLQRDIRLHSLHCQGFIIKTKLSVTLCNSNYFTVLLTKGHIITVNEQ